jgi:hypothetical protein
MAGEPDIDDPGISKSLIFQLPVIRWWMNPQWQRLNVVLSPGVITPAWSKSLNDPNWKRLQ